jgi:hypothetical protein
MPSQLGGLYRQHLQLEYTCVDRIHLRGYAAILQTCGGFRTWAERLRPDEPVTQSWIDSLARRFHQNVQRFANERGIAIIQPEKKQRKHLLADKYRQNFQRSEGVYLILKSFENARLFVSQEPSHPMTSIHRNLGRRWGFVACYYFYILDRHWGPICIAICSHPPFTARVLLNAHHWVERRAAARALNVELQGNAVLATQAPDRLQSLADSLGERDIRRVADRWVYRVLPVLSYKERHDSRFQYNWSIIQLEVSHNLVFRPSFPVAELFQRHIDLNRRLFCPTSIATLFGHRKVRSRDVNVSVYQSFASQTVLRIKHHSSTLKLYDKYTRILRNECVCNDPTRFGVGKLLTNFSELRARMTATLTRFLQMQHAVLDSTLDRGQLAALAKTSELGRSRVPGIRLENERILQVLHVASRIGSDPRGFSATQLRELVASRSGQPYTASQAAYDLRKLRAKGIVAQMPKTRRYALTALGARLVPTLHKIHTLFLAPTLAAASSSTPNPTPARRRGCRPLPPPSDLRSLLATHAGNVCAIARALDKQPCVVRRWIARENIDLTAYRTPVIRPEIEAAYATVDAALTELTRAVCLSHAA